MTWTIPSDFDFQSAAREFNALLNAQHAGLDLPALEFNPTAAAMAMRLDGIASIAAFDTAFDSDDSRRDQAGVLPDAGAAGFGDTPAPGPKPPPETPPVAPVPLGAPPPPVQLPPGPPASPMQPAPPPTPQPLVPQPQPSPPPLTPPVDPVTDSGASSSTTTNGPTGGIEPEHSPAQVDPGVSGSSRGGSGFGFAGGPGKFDFGGSGSGAGFAARGLDLSSAALTTVAALSSARVARDIINGDTGRDFGGATSDRDSDSAAEMRQLPPGYPWNEAVIPQPPAIDPDLRHPPPGYPWNEPVSGPAVPDPALGDALQTHEQALAQRNQDTVRERSIAAIEQLGSEIDTLTRKIATVEAMVPRIEEQNTAERAELAANKLKIDEGWAGLESAVKLGAELEESILAAQRLAHHARQSINQARGLMIEALTSQGDMQGGAAEELRSSRIAQQRNIIGEQESVYRDQTAEISRLRAAVDDLNKSLQRDNATIDQYRAINEQLHQRDSAFRVLVATIATVRDLLAQKVAEREEAIARLHDAEATEHAPALHHDGDVDFNDHPPGETGTTHTTTTTTTNIVTSLSQSGSHPAGGVLAARDPRAGDPAAGVLAAGDPMFQNLAPNASPRTGGEELDIPNAHELILLGVQPAAAAEGGV